MTRPHFLTPLEYYNLNVVCRNLWESFDESVGIFLVGSCLEKRDFRDVDIRLMLHDEAFKRLFPKQPADPVGKTNCPYWALICNSISEWLSQRTGLPIDFQIQDMTETNKRYDGKRSGIGI